MPSHMVKAHVQYHMASCLLLYKLKLLLVSYPSILLSSLPPTLPSMFLHLLLLLLFSFLWCMVPCSLDSRPIKIRILIGLESRLGPMYRDGASLEGARS